MGHLPGFECAVLPTPGPGPAADRVRRGMPGPGNWLLSGLSGEALLCHLGVTVFSVVSYDSIIVFAKIMFPSFHTIA